MLAHKIVEAIIWGEIEVVRADRHMIMSAITGALGTLYEVELEAETHAWWILDCIGMIMADLLPPRAEWQPPYLAPDPETGTITALFWVPRPREEHGFRPIKIRGQTTGP